MCSINAKPIRTCPRFSKIASRLACADALVIFIFLVALACAPANALARTQDTSAAPSAPAAIPADTQQPAIPPFNIAPLKTDPAVLAAITTQKYPDADSVFVDSLTSTRYIADGTNRIHEDSLIKILTEKGLRESRTRSFSYNAFYDEMNITLAQIIHPDGTTTPIDVKANTKEMIDRSQMDENIYDPNDKIITLAIPGLKIGDTFQVIAEYHQKRPIIRGVFSGDDHVEHPFPVIRDTFEVRGPKDKPLRAIALLDKVGDTVTHTQRDETNPDGTIDTIHTWTTRDVPQAFPEPAMPSFYISTQRVLASTAANWEEISKWYASICEPHLAPTQEIRAKVAELITPEKPADFAAAPTTPPAPLTDDEKINRIFRFVSQEIRYMGITVEQDNPGFEPHDVSLTFNNRYGVCRDKATLLATMLRVAGFDASPVLINAGPLVDKEVPYTRFNHAITAIRHKDGTYQLMDSTDENTADLFPSYLCNKSYLVARAEGDTLRVSPVAPPEQNMIRGNTVLNIANDGTVIGTTTLDFTGINDNAYRSSFAQAKPEDIRRYLESVVKKQLPGATLTAHEITPHDVMDTAKPLRITFAYTAPDFFTVNENKTLLSTPWFGAFFSIAGHLLGEGTGLAKRRFPLEIPYTCGASETLTIELPQRIGETLALPENTHIEVPAISYEKTCTRHGQTVTGKSSLWLRAPRVAAGAEYTQLKAALKDIEYSARQFPVLAAKPKTDLKPDIHTLASANTITLTDAHNWTSHIKVRKQVLTYAGKKDNAEIRIDYNPVWETVTLDSAKVTLKDGSTRTVAPSEINIMDAAWVASAPRYPAGKTLVVALPGVEIGSTIEYQITRTSKNHPWFSFGASFFSTDPIDSYTLTLNVPTNINLTTSPDLAQTLNKKPDTQNTKSEALRTYYVTGSCSAAADENNLPPGSFLGPIYEATTLNTPADYARLVSNAVAPLAEPTDTIRKKAAEITTAAGAKTETERLVAIRNYTDRTIRHVGPNFAHLPLTSLTPAEKTLADGYGNEADRSILLAALLKASGLKPELFLAATRLLKYESTGKDIFSPSQFPMLFVRAQADGKLCYLDRLSIYAEPGVTALDGCKALLLASPDSPIETITPDTFYKTYSKRSITIDLAPNGDAKVIDAAINQGVDHETAKKLYKEMTPEQLDRHHQQIITAMSQAAVADGELEVNYDYPLTWKVAAIIPRFAARSGDYIYFQIPNATTSAVPAGADTRTYPLYATEYKDFEKHWRILLPAGATIAAAPENLAWTGPADYGTVTVTTSTTSAPDGRIILEIVQRINIQEAIISPANYPSLLELNRRLSQPAQWRVLLKIPPQSKSAP